MVLYICFKVVNGKVFIDVLGFEGEWIKICLRGFYLCKIFIYNILINVFLSC